MQNGTRGILFHITNKGGRILEQQFDKQKMSQLVKQAMGEKTPFEYCRLSKLNSEYIDRLMTMQVKSRRASALCNRSRHHPRDLLP